MSDNHAQVELKRMLKEQPDKIIGFLLLQMARTAVKANAETMDFSCEATIDGVRYKIESGVKLIPIS